MHRDRGGRLAPLAHGPVRDHFLRSLPAHATYTTNLFVDFDVPHGIVFGCAWSLTVEEQFYLVWPWILRLRALTVAVLFMVAAALLREAGNLELLPIAADGLAMRFVSTIAVPICLGALLALGRDYRPTARALDAALGARWSAPVVGIATLAAIACDVPRSIVHVGMAALVGACTARPDHGLGPLTDNRAVRHVGVVSYGIYLLHGPIVGIARRVLDSPSLVFVVGFAASIAVASISHRFFERPFLDMRERFRPTRDAVDHPLPHRLSSNVESC